MKYDFGLNMNMNRKLPKHYDHVHTLVGMKDSMKVRLIRSAAPMLPVAATCAESGGAAPAINSAWCSSRMAYLQTTGDTRRQAGWASFSAMKSELQT